MAKPKLDAMMRRLERIIECENNENYIYEIPERLSYYLLDLGYIEFKRWNTFFGNCHLHFSRYVSTEKGREAYSKWKT